MNRKRSNLKGGFVLKDLASKLLLIAVVVLGIGYFIYSHQWNNINTLDTRATSEITGTQLPNTP